MQLRARGCMFGVLLVSAATLLCEIALTRIFAVTQGLPLRLSGNQPRPAGVWGERHRAGHRSYPGLAGLQARDCPALGCYSPSRPPAACT